MEKTRVNWASVVTSLSSSVGKFEKGKDIVGWLNNFENILIVSAGDDVSVLTISSSKSAGTQLVSMKACGSVVL